MNLTSKIGPIYHDSNAKECEFILCKRDNHKVICLLQLFLTHLDQLSQFIKSTQQTGPSFNFVWLAYMQPLKG